MNQGSANFPVLTVETMTDLTATADGAVGGERAFI